MSLPVDGSAPLADRRSYFKRQHTGMGRDVAVWTVVAAVCSWLLLAAVTGLVH